MVIVITMDHGLIVGATRIMGLMLTCKRMVLLANHPKLVKENDIPRIKTQIIMEGLRMRIVGLEFDDEEKKTLQGMAALTDLQFGEGWGDFDSLGRQLKEGARALVLEKDEEEDGSSTVVGMRVFNPPGTWNVSCWPDLAPCSVELWRDKGFRLETMSLARSIIIHPSYQRRGLGEKLLRESFKLAKSLGSEGMLCHVWAPQKSATALALKQRAEFPSIFIAKHADAWTKYSIDSCWQCPFCGNPCHCDAIEIIYSLL